jgi:tellurium resistance protein TerD
MAINLQKGGNANLSREVPGLSRVLIGLGWNARSTSGDDFDLDASAFLLSESGKVRSDSDFIFYNNKRSADGSVEHKGDNRTGAGDGDDENDDEDHVKDAANDDA